MEQIASLIEKLRNNSATVEELRHLQALLHSYSLEMPADALSEFAHVREGGASAIADEYHLTRLLGIITEKIGFDNAMQPESGGRTIKLGSWKRWVAAASIVVMAGSLFFWLNRVKSVQGEAALAKGQQHTIYRVNRTDTVESFVLSDGSHVALQSGGTLTCYENFESAKRDVVLTGTATFSVASDKTRPFTVHSGAIATTALGTKFTVAENSNGVVVKLYEGKVVIVSSKGDIGRQFLEPGHQLVYDQLHNTAKISSIGGEHKMAESAVKEQKWPSRREDPVISAGAIRFKATPFADAMRALENVYGVTIKVETSQGDRINITAEFKQTDSLPGILKKITDLNGLKIVEENGVYIIK